MKLMDGYWWGVLTPVAPHWGAWIEIRRTAPTRHCSKVAPHWGAWIEIHPILQWVEPLVEVAPHWGAWIEIPIE